MNLDGLGRATFDLGFMDRIRNTLARPDLRPAWKEARPILRADLKEHAKKGEGPGGAWPARSSSTRIRSKSGRRARRMLGRLPSSVRAKADRSRLVFRWRAPWSSVHQDGGTAGHGARIPARPFAWITDRALEATAKIVAKGLAYLIEVG